MLRTLFEGIGHVTVEGITVRWRGKVRQVGTENKLSKSERKQQHISHYLPPINAMGGAFLIILHHNGMKSVINV